MISFAEFLEESQSATIKALAREFGDNVVYLRSSSFDLETEDRMARLFKVLNHHLFEDKVDDIPLHYKTKDEMNKYLRGMSKDFEPIKEDVIGACTALFQFKLGDELKDYIKDLNGEKISKKNLDEVEVVFQSPQIMLNKEYLSEANFILCANSLCHEMIHRYDMLHGEFSDVVKIRDYSGIDIDSHTTFTFIEKKEQARKEHLKVKDQIDKSAQRGYDIRKLNDEAFNFMMKENFGSDEELDVIEDPDGNWVIDLSQYKANNIMTPINRYKGVIHLT